jgi:RNA-directed DNA polymerase
MRRVRVDLAEIAAIPSLAEATARAARGKRDRPEVRAFLDRLEESLDTLAQSILHGTAPRGEYRRFRIMDPKPRTIHAACFQDRVLHHAVMLHAGPVLERAMTDGSFACRPGKGALAAVQAVQSRLQRFPWYVKIDVSGYFEHIDHAILLQLLAQRFKGADFLDLLGRIVAGYESAPGKGLPIGSLTSQYFANDYLDGLDRLLLERLGARAQVRYMDDVLWWCDGREQARATLAAVGDWLDRERLLQIKDPPQINRSCHGVSFCGYRVQRGALLLNRRRRQRYQARRAHWEDAWRAGEIDSTGLQRGYDAVRAIAIHADSRTWRCNELARHPAPEV